MKKFYLKPEARFVDINTSSSLLENQPEVSDQGNVTRVWDEDGDNLPIARSVWGSEEEEQ